MSTRKIRQFVILDSPPTGETLELWSDLLANASFPTHYVSPAFFTDPLTGSGDRFAILALDGGSVTAVLTGLSRSRSFISGLSVRPQIAFRKGTDRSVAAENLLAGVNALPGTRRDLIELHSWESFGDTIELVHEVAAGQSRVVMLDLSKGAEQLFKEFSERRRTALRKAVKQAKVTIKMLETETELDETFELYREWTRSKGFQPKSRDSFSVMLDSKYRKVLLAIHEEKIIAATYIRFCPNGVVEYAANNSLDGYQKLHANELLGWRAIEWACSAGFTHFSMGASHTFLSRFGGDLVSSHRYRRDNTLLKIHANRERATRLAAKAYLSLPGSVRKHIRKVVKKV